MRWGVLFSLVGLLAWPVSAAAQTFSGDQTLFTIEITQYFQTATKPSVQSYGEEFLSAWGGLGADNRDKVIELAQGLERHGFKQSNQPYTFFKGLQAAINGGHSDATLSGYLDMVTTLLDGYDHKQFTLFLNKMRNFWEHNALVDAGRAGWYYEDATLTFELVGFAEPQGDPLLEQLGQDDRPDDFLADDQDTGLGWDDPIPEDDDQEEFDDNEWLNSTEWATQWDDQPDNMTMGESGMIGGYEDVSSGPEWQVTEKVSDREEQASMIEILATPMLPQVSGPVVKFSTMNLLLQTPHDSVVVPGVKDASWMIMGDVLVAEGGKVDWQQVGLDPGEVYAELGPFALDLNTTELNCGDAYLHHSKHLDQPVHGKLQLRSRERVEGRIYTYPRFMSYGSYNKVRNLGEGMDFEGGFSMSGPLVYTDNVLHARSRMRISHQGEQKLSIRSRRFDFYDSVLTAGNAEVALYHGRDSIYHPGVNVRYSERDNHLMLLESSSHFRHTSYTSTYFDVEIRSDLVTWDFTKDSINFNILQGKTSTPALFVSEKYYSPDEFREITGIYEFQPLSVLAAVYKQRRTATFTADEVANLMNLSLPKVHHAMVLLASRNFIDYNLQTRKITILDKAAHWILSNRQRADYDNLLIPSLARDKPNATFMLDSGKMTIRGINEFYISRELDVFIRPENNSIDFLPGRDFLFDGKLYAGNLEFIGKEFRFSYDNFLISMEAIDSIEFYVREQEGRTNYNEASKLDNKLVGLDFGGNAADSALVGTNVTSGTLYINEPDNKAAVREVPNYPRFDGSSGAFVYFDRPQVLDGAYDKRVMFEVPPFKLDSLSDTNPATIGFDGTFKTGGILPPIETKLTVQADKSLGFTYTAPAEGFPLYETDARFFGTITMNADGLRGQGYVDYLTSHIEAGEFIFYQDSMVAEGNKVEMTEGTLAGASFPKMVGNDFHIRWKPYQDSLYMTNKGLPFVFYGGTATLDGEAIITTEGINGKGILTSDRATAQSDEISFTETQFLARHTQLDVNSDVPGQPIIKGDDILVDFDVVNNVADLSPEVEGVAALDFPFAQFKTSIANARWDYAERTVTMTKPPEVAIESSIFYTTNPEKDSLAFYAEEAVYDIATQRMQVEGVPFIKSADALVIPKGGTVEVLEGFALQPFEEARVVLDTLHRQHTFVDATVNVLSRNRFTGQGSYRIGTAAADTFDIQFQEFELRQEAVGRKDSVQYTYAEGKVLPEDEVQLSAGMMFKGNLYMKANDPDLDLDGYLQLNEDELEGDPVWIEYAGTISTEKLVLPYANLVTEAGRKLRAGLHYGAESADLYANLAGNQKDPSDISVFSPEGELRYDLEKDAYIIAEKLGEDEQVFGQKYFAFFGHTGQVSLEGDVRLMEGTEDAKLAAAAVGQGSVKNVQYSLDAFLNLQMELHGSAIDLLAEDVSNMVQAFGAPLAEEDFDALVVKMAHLLGERAVSDWYEVYNVEGYYPVFEADRSLSQLMTFSRVDLEWDAEHNAWYSKGKLGLSNVGDYDINASLDGFLEIVPPAFGEPEKLNLFLQLGSGIWYCLQFSENHLTISSSYREFNELVSGKSKAAKAKPGEYYFQTGERSMALDFVNRFRANYLGITAPYDLGTAPEPQAPTDDPGDYGSDGDQDPQPQEEEEESQPYYDDGF